jgi:HNH endonuclease
MNELRRLCTCGCGQQTNTDPSGNPRRYLRGHNRLGVGKGWIEGGYWHVSIDGQKVAFHRWLVEQMLGRPLTSEEVVHHVDGDPLNNDPDNLVLLSRSEHQRLHTAGIRRRRWSEQEIARARELHEAGMTIQRVSTAIGRPFSSTAGHLATRPKPRG